MSNDKNDPSTTTDEPIRRPDNANHSMVIQKIPGQVRASVGDTIIAESSRALWIRESAGRDFDPVVYFPSEDVQRKLLTPVTKTTHCPLKGTASYFDLISDAQKLEQIAWSYQQVLDFDPRLEQIKDYFSFDQRQVEVQIDT